MPCVCMQVKFYGVPKLGAYLAVPVTYPSGLHDEVKSAHPPLSTNKVHPSPHARRRALGM
jgi:hypothetical protein